MMVFWQERLAILATPKTASTAIEAALGGLAAVVIQRPRALKHTNAARFASFWKPYLAQAAGAEFEVAALMRHPRDWLGSWYRDGQRDDVEQDRSTRGMSFDDFVQAYCAPGPRPSYADVGSQAEFLGATGPARVDRLFRYEDLSGFLEFLEEIRHQRLTHHCKRGVIKITVLCLLVLPRRLPGTTPRTMSFSSRKLISRSKPDITIVSPEATLMRCMVL